MFPQLRLGGGIVVFFCCCFSLLLFLFGEIPLASALASTAQYFVKQPLDSCQICLDI